MYEVSIIIPHYNTPDLLRVLLASIPPLEEIQVIVVDDHSTKELEILAQVKKQYGHVTFLENREKGIGNARNLGLQEAKGTWILFADADDYFLPDFYSKMQVFFESSYDIIFFTPTSVELDTGHPSDRHIETKLMIQDFLHHPNQGKGSRLRYCVFEVWSKLIRREVIDAHGLCFGKEQIGEDVIFSMKTGFYAKEIAATLEEIYCVTRSRGSVTTIKTDALLQIRTDVFIQRHLFLKEHLSRNDRRKAHSSPINLLLNSLVYGFGFASFWTVFSKLVKNKVPFLRFSDGKVFLVKLKKKRLKHYVVSES